jgi:hypothetical protein
MPEQSINDLARAAWLRQPETRDHLLQLRRRRRDCQDELTELAATGKPGIEAVAGKIQVLAEVINVLLAPGELANDPDGDDDFKDPAALWERTSNV